MAAGTIGRPNDFQRPRHRCGWVAFAAAFLLILPAVSASAQSAGGWNKRGVKAEAREDFDAAYEAFRQAHEKSPSDLRYKTRFERTRFEAANMHVDRGRVLRQSGDKQGAINEFARALQIDPGNQAAAQELQITDTPGGAVAPAAPGAPPAAVCADSRAAPRLCAG